MLPFLKNLRALSKAKSSEIVPQVRIEYVHESPKKLKMIILTFSPKTANISNTKANRMLPFPIHCHFGLIPMASSDRFLRIIMVSIVSVAFGI